MTQLVLNGIIGLLLGIALHLCRVDEADVLLRTLALRRRGESKALLWAAGLTAILMAFLAWLAVIDVDRIPVVPLTGRVLMGGTLAGVSLGLTGFTPETAFAGVGGGRFTESLCAVLGCVAAYFVLPWAEQQLTVTEAWFAPIRKTLFRVTLDEAYFLPGSFLAQGGIGLAAWLMALCIRRWRPAPPPAPAAPVESAAPPVSLEPETVQEETIVVTLPGEEPVVVDAEEPEPPAGEAAEDPPESE